MMSSLLFILVIGMTHAISINIVVPKSEEECVFVSKKKFEYLDAQVRISCFQHVEK
jgi:hypothetical protein